MAIALLSSPRRDDTPLGSISNVAAGLSQLPYKFRREDSPIEDSTESDIFPGKLRVWVEFNVPSELGEGDTIFISSVGFTGNATVLGAGIFLIDVNVDWTANIGAGFVNWFTVYNDYAILVEPVDALTSVSYIPSPESYRPKQSGELFVNLSNILIPVVQQAEQLNYRLRYYEYYGGMVRNTYIDDTVFAMPAKKQLLDVGGSNMWEFLLQVANVAKQYTAFKYPVVWIGWASWSRCLFDEFIIDRVPGSDVGVVIKSHDVNKVILLDQPFTEDPGILPRLYKQEIAESFKIEPLAFYISTQYMTAALVPLSEQLFFEIKKPCFNPIMVEWINKNGLPEYWLFERMQTVDNVANEGQVYESPIIDTFDVTPGNLKRVTAGGYQYITLLAENVRVENLLALHEMKESLSVKLWLDTTGDKAINCVVINSYDTGINTKARRGSYSVRVQLPKNFNFYKQQ